MTRPKRTKRIDVINAFTRGKSVPPQPTFLWFSQDNTLFYGKVVIAVRDPITMVITKTEPDSLKQFYTGSELAAMLRGQNEIELYTLEDNGSSSDICSSRSCICLWKIL